MTRSSLPNAVKAGTGPRSAFLLMEMLAVVSLLAVFALVAAKLFASCMHQTRDLRQAQDAVSRWDHASPLLRADVWGSVALEAEQARGEPVKRGDAHTLLVRQPGGQSVTWQIGSDGSLVRQVQGAKPVAPYRWAQVGARSFVLHGPVVMVRIGDGEKGEDRQVCFVSQMQLMGGTRP